MPFLGNVVVQEISDDEWQVLEPLEYRGNVDHFVVESGFTTDFASVPTIFTWLLPRYGRYTKAAILHDWLCQRAREGLIDRSDADGMFRRSMRELGVPFLKRWLMWAAVRAEAAKRFGLKELWRPAAGTPAAFLVTSVLGLVYLIIPGIVIVLALLVFYLAEWLAYAILRAVPQRRPAAAVETMPSAGTASIDPAPAKATAPAQRRRTVVNLSLIHI